MNGTVGTPSTGVHNPAAAAAAALHAQYKNTRNYKLLIDPALVKGAVKLYRYDGIVPGDPKHPAVLPRDPRNQMIRLRSRLEPHDIPVPRYIELITFFFYCPLSFERFCLQTLLHSIFTSKTTISRFFDFLLLVIRNIF